MANTIYETSVMTWISPSKCSKRDAELQAASKLEAKSAISLEKQALVAVPQESPETDTSTELRLQWALMRRGIALDQCRLLSWEIHQKWVTTLMEALCESPPPGYAAINAAQVVRADHELWTLLAGILLAPIRLLLSGSLRVMPYSKGSLRMLVSRSFCCLFEVRLPAPSPLRPRLRTTSAIMFPPAQSDCSPQEEGQTSAQKGQQAPFLEEVLLQAFVGQACLLGLQLR